MQAAQTSDRRGGTVLLVGEDTGQQGEAEEDVLKVTLFDKIMGSLTIAAMFGTVFVLIPCLAYERGTERADHMIRRLYDIEWVERLQNNGNKRCSP